MIIYWYNTDRHVSVCHFAVIYVMTLPLKCKKKRWNNGLQLLRLIMCCCFFKYQLLLFCISCLIVLVDHIYLIARLNFSYVILSLFLRLPHSCATASDWTKRNTPSRWFSHRTYCGLYIGFIRTSYMNSHKCWFFAGK